MGGMASLPRWDWGSTPTRGAVLSRQWLIGVIVLFITTKEPKDTRKHAHQARRAKRPGLPGSPSTAAA
jgi:hypothetical protein